MIEIIEAPGFTLTDEEVQEAEHRQCGLMQDIAFDLLFGEEADEE